MGDPKKKFKERLKEEFTNAAVSVPSGVAVGATLLLAAGASPLFAIAATGLTAGVVSSVIRQRKSSPPDNPPKNSPQP